MPIETANTDSNGIASFTKTLYDDDANSLSVEALEVVRTNLTVHDPAKTPNWLSYTTATRSTQEGPEGNRTYLDVTVEIDTNQLGAGDVHELRLAATDGFNTVSQNFRFQNGEFVLENVTDCQILWDPSRESGGSGYTPTNYGNGNAPAISSIDADYVTNVIGEHAGMDVDGGITLGGPLLPTGSSAQPFSLFVVMQNGDYYDGPRTIIQQDGGNLDMDLDAKYNNLRYEKDSPDGSFTGRNTDAKHRGDQLGLFEYHKRPDETFLVSQGGEKAFSGSDADPFANGNTTLAYHSEQVQVVLFAFYMHDLTQAQVEGIRKQMLMRFPSMPIDNIAAPEFA